MTPVIKQKHFKSDPVAKPAVMPISQISKKTPLIHDWRPLVENPAYVRFFEAVGTNTFAGHPRPTLAAQLVTPGPLYARQRYPQINIVVMSRDREHTACLMPKVPYGHQRLNFRSHRSL
ncbi:hypothetical protein [Bradyrhizobium sp. RDI18]|uniref:hypothetical protein n=1 Tax=Bradyrhizobium sp. RDI18 TaxID=3367400 RepID=UPI0037245A54